MKKEQLLEVSEIELTYRTKVKAKDRPRILCSEDSYQVLLKHWSDDIELRERFNILLLNRSMRVLGMVNISTGGIWPRRHKNRISIIMLIHNKNCYFSGVIE